MAQQAALATASVQEPVALGELAEALVPAEPQTPATVTHPAQTSQPNTTDVVRIGDEDISIEEAKKLITKGRAFSTEFDRLTQLRAENQEAMQLYATWQAMSPDEQQNLLNYAESMADAKESGQPVPQVPITGGKPLAVSLIDLPADAEIEHMKWDDLGDEARYTYAVAMSLRQEIRALGRIVAGMRQYLGQIHVSSQDDKIAKALRLHGVVIDADGVRELRENGISDPMKAIPFLKSRQKNAAPATNGNGKAAVTPPPEAPVAAGDNVFNDDDPALTADMIASLMAQGKIPASTLKKA